ncbi:MAG: hypothetical protein AAGD96_04080 [Chloroflexota bacterium]
MNFGKYFYMGLGAFIAIAIGAGAFAFTQSTEASANNGIIPLQADLEFSPTLQDGIDDASHRGRNGRGKGERDNSALLEELGVTQEEWDTAEAAVRALYADAEERPSRDEIKSAFAAELGVTVEAFEAAQEAVKEARLAEALANGNITQEQIDLREARQALAETIDKKEIAATVLGVTVEELEEARENRTMRDLIAETGLTRDEIRTATEAAYQDAIDQAVANGDITPEQAELLEENGLKSRKGNRGNRGRGNNNSTAPEVESADA